MDNYTVRIRQTSGKAFFWDGKSRRYRACVWDCRPVSWTEAVRIRSCACALDAAIVYVATDGSGVWDCDQVTGGVLSA